jgi:hypothetical protein
MANWSIWTEFAIWKMGGIFDLLCAIREVSRVFLMLIPVVVKGAGKYIGPPATVPLFNSIFGSMSNQPRTKVGTKSPAFDSYSEDE